MVKKKGCICWPTIRRTGSKSSGRMCQQTRCDDEEAKKEDGVLTGESATDLPPSIPAEHDNFLEMLFPSTGRQRSRTLSLSSSHHQTDKRMLHRRHDNQTCATTLAGFRDRTHSSLSFAGRRMGPPMGLPPMGPSMGPPMGNDLLLLDMVPTTPDYTYSTRRTGAFTAATFPLGLRGGGGGERADGGWPGYMGRQRRRGLEQKKLQQQERCQCSGCSDDNCSSLFKFPASPAEDDDDDDEDDEQEEEEEDEETVEHQFGPFFDNESYYNRQQQQQQGGCWRREQRKVSAGYDQPTMCFHQMHGRGARLYDVPRSTKHRPVFCSKDACERICPRHHQEAAARYSDDQDQRDARYQDDDGDQHEVRCRRGELVEDYNGQLGIPRQPQETRRRQSASKMADDDDDDAICDVDGATSKAAAAPDVQGSHYARPIEWRRKTGGRRVRQQQQQEVLVCRRCFVCQLKLEEEGCGAATGSYHRMSAIPSPRTNTLRRCNGEESSYVLSDRISASDFGKAFDYIVPSQRIGGAKERDGKGADGRNGEKLPADGGYLTPLSARNEKLTRDNKMNLPKEIVEEAKRESPLLSMRQFLKETQRGTETEKKEEFIEKKKKKRDDSTHPRDDNIQAAKATNKVDSDDHQPSPSFLRETDLGSEDGIRQNDWAEAPSSSDPLSSTTKAVGSGLQQSPEEPQEREDAGEPGLGSNCRGNPDEGGLGKEEQSQRKLQSIAMDSVKSGNEDEGRKFKDIVVKGSCLSKVEKEDQEAGAAGLQVVPSDSVSQLDLLLMCPPPQCFQMVNFSYMNVTGQSKAKATACSSNGGAAVVVHRDHKCVVDEMPDSSSCSNSCSDIQRLQATNERSNGFHCCEMKPTSCKRQLKTEIEEDGKEEEEEEENVGLCQRPSISPLARLFKNTPSELDFYYNPCLPSMEESLRSICLAN